MQQWLHLNEKDQKNIDFVICSYIHIWSAKIGNFPMMTDMLLIQEVLGFTIIKVILYLMKTVKKTKKKHFLFFIFLCDAV